MTTKSTAAAFSYSSGNSLPMYTHYVHAVDTHTGLTHEATGQFHRGPSFTMLLLTAKSSSASISISRALLSNDHSDKSIGTIYAPIPRTSDVVLGISKIVLSIQKMEAEGKIRNILLPSPFSQRYSVASFLASSLYSCLPYTE